MSRDLTPETVSQVERPGDGGRNKIDWRPQETALPMKRVEKGSFMGGAIALILGGMWGTLIGGAIIDAIHERGVSAEIAMLVIFVSPGIFTILYGIGQFLFHHEITVAREKVTVTTVGLRGRRQWSEPVSSYKGVLKQTRLYMPSEAEWKIGSTYDFTLRLAHAKRSKEIVLYETSSRYPLPPATCERQWHHYAESLRLPRLEDIATD